MKHDEQTRDDIDRIIVAALREAPELQLSDDFVSRTVQRALPRRASDRLIYALLAVAAVPMVLLTLLLMKGPLPVAWLRLSALLDRAAPSGAVPIEPLSWAIAAILLTALIDRILAARIVRATRNG